MDDAPELVVYWFPQGPFDTYPGRPFRLMRQVARHVPVVGITTKREGRLRRPKITIEPMGEPGLTLATITTSSAWTRLARRSPQRSAGALGARFRRALARHGLPTRYLLWFSGTGKAYVQGMRSGPVVIDLIDPPFTSDSEALLAHILRGIAAVPDLFFATAQVLGTEIERAGGDVELLPNGCDPTTTDARAEPPATPTLGYLGTLDWRFDWAFVEEVARRAPDWRIVLAGRVLTQMEDRAERLAALPNVELRGPTPHDVDPFAVLREFTVGMIPFRTGFVGDAINPVKMYEYAAADLPVIASPIQECRGLEPLVSCRRSAEEWVAALPDLVRSRVESRSERRAFVEANTWERRADQAVRSLRARHLLASATDRSAGS